MANQEPQTGQNCHLTSGGFEKSQSFNGSNFSVNFKNLYSFCCMTPPVFALN